MTRVIHKAYMPMNGGTIRTATKQHINGRGNGSVLLDGGLGGAGSASSYTSLEDYINTTHQNPLQGQPKTISTVGRGIESMNNKIENLLVKTKKRSGVKEKNINFNL